MDIERMFKKIVDDTKARYKSDLIEAVWYRTKLKIAEMKDNADDSKDFVFKIQEHVETRVSKMPVEVDDDLTYRAKEALLTLWILYVAKADPFSFGEYNTENVLKSERFFLILLDYFDLPAVWNKLVATYEFLKKHKNPRETVIIKAYFNVWAFLPEGKNFLFLGVEDRIFPPPVKVKLNYATNKRKRGPNDDDEYGHTQIKVKYGEGSRGGSDDGRTQSRARYAEPSTERDRGGSDDGRSSTRTKPEPNLKY